MDLTMYSLKRRRVRSKQGIKAAGRNRGSGRRGIPSREGSRKNTLSGSGMSCERQEQKAETNPKESPHVSVY